MRAWLPFGREGREDRRTALASLARFAAVAIVLLIAIIAIGEVSRTDDASRTVTPSATIADDPLAADLARCRNVTSEQLSAVNTCRRVWAENRKRFFTSNKPAEAR